MITCVACPTNFVKSVKIFWLTIQQGNTKMKQEADEGLDSLFTVEQTEFFVRSVATKELGDPETSSTKG